MFVLYYNESDYDRHQVKIIKVSKDRDKLETLKKQFEQESFDFYQSVRDWMARQQEFYKNKRNEVADWFEQNMAAILEYPRNAKYGKWDKLGDGSFSPQGLSRTEKYYSDWHTANFGPYHPDVVIKHKKEFIQKVRDRIDYSPCHSYEPYVDYSKTQNSFPKDENFPEIQPEPKTENYHYQSGTLFIEEVDEI